MSEEKPLVLRIHDNHPELGTVDVVWCPFWGKRPESDEIEDRANCQFLNMDKNEKNIY